jgi:manganese transport protein
VTPFSGGPVTELIHPAPLAWRAVDATARSTGFASGRETGDSFWRKMVAFAGPGYLVAVGYMDPGNWATDLAGGSAYGYDLLCVVLLSSLMAMILQILSAKLGIVTGCDLAQNCRDHYPPIVSLCLWLASELAICACDLAEVIGTAIALKLLFGLPLVLGVCLTALDVLVILHLQRWGLRSFETLIVALIVLIGASFAFEVALAQPSVSSVLAGFLPRAQIATDPGMLYLAIGILGATVMPHNLYLHSSVVQSSGLKSPFVGKREAIRFASIDSGIALTLAFVVNGAILVVAAATFHANGQTDVVEIEDAQFLLAPLLGNSLAGTVFALALLASGLAATLTATLAGQIVMEGFLRIRIAAGLRRLLTRLVAIVPALAVTALHGDGATSKLLILSQVVLSLQLPLAVIPLLQFTGQRRMMGAFANGALLTALAWSIGGILVALNGALILNLAGML